jgi:hypothetical protein
MIKTTANDGNGFATSSRAALMGRGINATGQSGHHRHPCLNKGLGKTLG